MAILFDTTSVGNILNQAVASPLTWSHTCTGSDLVLLLGIQIESGKTIGNVTYNSVLMTQLTTIDDQFSNHYYVYGLINPATGSNTVSISWTGGNAYVSGTAASYIGVQQNGLPDATATKNQNSGTSISHLVTTIARETWVTCFVKAAADSLTAGSGITLRSTTGLGNQHGWGDSNSTVSPGSYSMTVNCAESNAIDILMVSIAATGIVGFKSLLGVGQA